MNVGDFELITRILRERSGLVLTQDKAYLIESRLNPVARKWQFNGFEELAAAVRLGKDERLLRDVTEAMTTNESFFFRDSKPFDQFRDIVLPHMLQARAAKRGFRIWSAACSSGQEPYSLAMILKDNEAKLAGWNIEIVATDLSTEILEKAIEGTYSQFEVQRGLPINYLVMYLKQDGDRWVIDDAIRRMVSYTPFNLLTDPAPLGRFDVVFIRNVLIYFEQETKSQVLAGIARQIEPDGFLYLGGAETVLGLSNDFQLIPGQRGIYGPTSGQSEVRAAG